jgi:DNA excision repair protein ERCC-6
MGGYANATPSQAQLAYRCALVLRGLIDPYLLRRQKKDIGEIIRLPRKTEQVLFCRLTPRQRSLYMDVLTSPEVARVLQQSSADRYSGALRGARFRAIGVLRKLCNHADLVCPPGAGGESLASRFADVADGDSDVSDEVSSLCTVV